MSPADASAADAALVAPPGKRSAPLVALRQIVAMALPFMLGAIVTSVLNLGMIAILAHAGHDHALATLSLLQPAFIFVIAVMEGLAITNQVFSAKSKHNWPRRGIAGSSWRLSLLASLLLGAAAGAVYAFTRWGGLLQLDGLGLGSLDKAAAGGMAGGVAGQTLAYLPQFVLSMIPFVIFDICYAALRGQGKLVRSLLPFATLAVISLGVTYVLSTRYGWGFEAVLAGNLAGPLAMLPVMVALLSHEAGHGPAVPRPAMRARLGQLLMVVGGPLAVSVLAGAISAAVIFPALAGLGHDYASGLMVVLRFRIAFMIPAIAFASVIAILTNQAEETANPAERVHYLAVGVPVLLACYAALTLALPYYSGPVLDLLLSQRGDGAALRGATQEVLTQLQITFFLIGAGTAMQVILEQLGRAPQVLAINILTEVATCGATLYALGQGADVTMVMMILKAVAGASFALLLVQLLILFGKVRRGHAV